MAPSSAPLPTGWRPRARDDVVFRHLGGGWVLFDPQTQRIHVLDVTTALLWSFCTGDSDVQALDAEVRRAFGAALDDPQVPQALQGLLELGLLHAP